MFPNVKTDAQLTFLLQDLRRWKSYSFEEAFYSFFELGVWATILFRISRALYLIDIPIFKILFRIVAFFIYKFSEIFLGVALSPGINIGPGLYIGHTGLVRIHPEVKIGKNLSIGSGTTIGTKGVGNKGAPELGDNVYIGLGAKILGKIKIGNNVRIGANAVVVTDIPDNATAVGIPARVVKINNQKIKQ